MMFLIILSTLLSWYCIFKFYNYWKSRPPKHTWDDNATEWIWENNKPIRKATHYERQAQNTVGGILPFSNTNPNHYD